MGYHSSPTLAALLTFFNIRLGWWLGNPGIAGNADYHRNGPKSGVYYWIREAFGLTNDASPYVYLSDGGHFENLGLYEMVLRRCKIIVVSDAGCDPTCSLEDLGNAIRKIRIDQGIDIKIEEFGILSRQGLTEGQVGKYCAIGTIDYEAVDGPPAIGEPSRAGTLIYLKPAIYGIEPKDVFNYQKSNKAFPHEPTSDQWFSESQFESYRVLGLHIMERISEEMRRKGPGRTTAKDLAEFLKSAEDYVSIPLGARPFGWPPAGSPLWGGY